MCPVHVEITFVPRHVVVRVSSSDYIWLNLY